MKNQIGFNSGGVNIYYVDTVDIGSGAATMNGVWCGGGLVAMGWNASYHLFVHEIGHAHLKIPMICFLQRTDERSSIGTKDAT